MSDTDYTPMAETLCAQYGHLMSPALIDNPGDEQTCLRCGTEATRLPNGSVRYKAAPEGDAGWRLADAWIMHDSYVRARSPRRQRLQRWRSQLTVEHILGTILLLAGAAILIWSAVQ